MSLHALVFHHLALVEGAIKDLFVTRLGRLYMKLPPRKPFISTLLMQFAYLGN